MKRPGIVRECEHPGRPHSHGYECYRFDGCRCRVGRAQHAQDAAQRRKLKALGLHRPALVDSTGSRRRIEALMTLGYTAQAIGDRTGLSRHAIYNLLRERSLPRLLRTHAEKIAAVYDELWDKPAPPSRGARYVSRQAARRGHAPPLAWDDDTIDDPNAEPRLDAEGSTVDWVAIDRALQGEDVVLSQDEKHAAALSLFRAGATKTSVAKTLRISGKRAIRLEREAA